MLQRWPLKNPTNVMFPFFAILYPEFAGAAFDARIGTPERVIFITISAGILPL